VAKAFIVVLTLPTLSVGQSALLGPLYKRDGLLHIYAKPDRVSGFSQASKEDQVAEYAKDVLVDTQWVEDHLDDDSIRIVEVDENPALYAEAHIPGAIGFDWKTDLQDQVKRDFLGPEAFGELFGSRGVSNDHTIVLYGDRNNWFAAYTYWYLKYYGHDDVKLVNGPREKWISEGRPVNSEVPSYPSRTFTAQPGDEAIRAKRDEVLAALGKGTNLVDVRSPQEYSGELIAMAGYEQEGAQRGGHIPGAASVPWAQAVGEDGTFKSADELRELYGGKGVLDGKTIAYCRIGERSAHTWFVLHELLGQPDVKNYDGSWTEWGNMVGVPVEKDV
jgi:thiosulfate/3-mercaptopyruvate sulfurtransferase